MLLFLNVIYVLIAIAMVALILMQRGAGAQAGSGFGGGASGTVFGARGSSNFLSKATKWLAVSFFAISLFMAYQATHRAQSAQDGQDLGVMSQVPLAPGSSPAGTQTIPSAPATVSPVPAAPQVPATDSAVPATPTQPAPPPSGG